MKKTGKRRRGDALSENIYNATIETIKKVGYTNLTFQQIAHAAKTAEPSYTAAGKPNSI